MGETTESAAVTWRLETWFPDFSKETHQKLRKYYDELSSANKTMSLVSPKTLPFADGIHFADSAMGMNFIFKDAPSAKEFYDFGSGPGFPGLVGAILRPDIKFTLVEIDDKKIEFLRRCVANLSLGNVSLLKGNLEALPANSVKFAVARGLSNISKSILMARKCMEKGGTFYHMKSENWSMEVGEIPTQLCSVWSPALVSEYRLPIGEVRFAIVKTTKIS